jgi:hypothetical protein
LGVLTVFSHFIGERFQRVSLTAWTGDTLPLRSQEFAKLLSRQQSTTIGAGFLLLLKRSFTHADVGFVQFPQLQRYRYRHWRNSSTFAVACERNHAGSG